MPLPPIPGCSLRWHWNSLPAARWRAMHWHSRTPAGSARWSPATSASCNRRPRRSTWRWSPRITIRWSCCGPAGRCTTSWTSVPPARRAGTEAGAGLSPSPDYAGGPLRLLPFVLLGADAVLEEVGEAFERDLVETGMAGADTALLAQELFGVQVEHARYLTLADLVAMTALQYEHAGLAPLWPLLEAALLAPSHEEWLDAPPEPLAHYADGEARIALFSPAAWRERYAADAGDDDARLERGFAHFQARQRQFAAVLGAHGVPVT